jgi:DNA-3-methyladenine glycosylase I
MQRCPWPEDNPQMIAYHDLEWGNPVHDDQKLFEFLILDCFQAGLSWAIILKKREAFREVFDGFDLQKVAAFGEERIEQALQNPAIVRNRQKINAAVQNARAVLRIQQEFGSFDRYLWQFTDGLTLLNRWKTLQEVPAASLESERMSKDLRQRGLSFVGPTICYAVMQSTGMVNDHLVECFRYAQIAAWAEGGKAAGEA